MNLVKKLLQIIYSSDKVLKVLVIRNLLIILHYKKLPREKETQIVLVKDQVDLNTNLFLL